MSGAARAAWWRGPRPHWSVVLLGGAEVVAVAAGLAGLAVGLRAAGRRPGGVWLALPLFWLAFYSKQTAIAAAGAACVWLILRNGRRGLAFTGVYIAGAAGGSLLL